MANNFTSLWSATFSWFVSILTLNLPIYFGNTSLTLLDIIIGTVGIFVAFAAVRALLKSGFTIAGKDLIEQKKSANSLKVNREFGRDAVNRQIAKYAKYDNVPRLNK